MKILTIGASPYLLVRNGKINADIINRLVFEGHDVSSAVWHHDEGYFMPSEEGVHSYEKDNKNICQLYPFSPKTDESSPFIYELMKSVQPEIVITIGDHKDTNFLYAIKAMYPNLFKWIAIYTIDCNGIPSQNKDAFEYADYIITTNEFSLKEISSFANVEGLFIPYGPDKVFKYDKSSKRDLILCSSRNAQSSNIASFLKSTSGVEFCKFIPYLHTNMYDPGDYSIDSLKEKYKSEYLQYTTDYCSIKEGITENKMVEIYNRSAIIVDCSIKSATGLSLLEGMACGCIPVGMDYGRIGEIISLMPEKYRFTVPYNIFVGQNEEEFAIICPNKLRMTLLEIKNKMGALQEASEAAINVANMFSNKSFVDKLLDIIQKVRFSKESIALDVI